MTEWWTYHLSDFLLFSPATYRRLFELYNAVLWPAQPVVVAAGLVLFFGLLRRRPWAPRAAAAALGLAWLWTAWAFHLQRYATINWAATWFAGAFALQGFWLFAASLAATPPVDADGNAGADDGGRHAAPRRVGAALLLCSLVGAPLLTRALDLSWRSVEVFGLTPDATALGTLGCLLLLQGRQAGAPRGVPRWRWLAWPIPLLWCCISGATLWTMHRPDALVLPVAAALALVAAWHARRPGKTPPRG